MRKSVIAKFGAHLERQTPLKVYADRCGHRTSEELVEEKIQSHVKEFSHKIGGDKRVKHKKHELWSEVSSSKSNYARPMQGHVSRTPHFSAIRSQNLELKENSPDKLTFPMTKEPPTILQQVSLSQANPNTCKIYVEKPDDARNITVLMKHLLICRSPSQQNANAEPAMSKNSTPPALLLLKLFEQQQNNLWKS